MKALLQAALQAPSDPAVERILRDGFYRAAPSEPASGLDGEGVVVLSLAERRRRCLG